MKRIFILLLLFIPCLLSCDKDSDKEIEPEFNQLFDSSLNLIKMVENGKTIPLSEEELTSEKQYTLTLKKDGTFFAFSSSNSHSGTYLVNTSTHEISLTIELSTEVGESPTGEKYVHALRNAKTYTLEKVPVYGPSSLSGLSFKLYHEEKSYVEFSCISSHTGI